MFNKYLGSFFLLKGETSYEIVEILDLLVRCHSCHTPQWDAHQRADDNVVRHANRRSRTCCVFSAGSGHPHCATH